MCGNAHNIWTAEAIVTAAQLWTETHGAPPKMSDWHRGTPDHPSDAVVRRVFRYWNHMLEAADLPVRKAGGGHYKWTRDSIAEAMLDHLLRTGRWPTSSGWASSAAGTGRPAQATVLRFFGTWNAAKRYAGWDEIRNGVSRAVAPCSGCGCDIDVYTDDCRTCFKRRWNRADRAKRSAARTPVQDTRDAVTATPGGGDLSTREAATAARRAA